MNVRRGALISIALVVLIQIAGCSSVKVTKTWRDPGLSGPVKFQKIATLCMHPDKYVRRAVEDEMVKQIGADRAVAGYTILSDDDRKDVKQVKAKLQSAGADGAVLLKLAGARSDVGHAPAAGADARFDDDYDSAGGYMNTPEASVSDTIIAIQTNIYSVAEGKLIWSGTIELRNPADARQIVDSVAKAVGDELRKEKLIQ